MVSTGPRFTFDMEAFNDALRVAQRSEELHGGARQAYRKLFGDASPSPKVPPIQTDPTKPSSFGTLPQPLRGGQVADTPLTPAPDYRLAQQARAEREERERLEAQERAERERRHQERLRRALAADIRRNLGLSA